MESSTATTDPTKPALSPPYAPFRTLLSLIERMEKEGDAPARIDKSYLVNVPWSAQDQLMQACRSLGLIDASNQPTESLKRLVLDPDGRKQAFAAILKERYPAQLALGTNATQDQLADVFKAGGTTGATLTKAVRFFLHAAQYAEIPLSPHFKAPRAESAPRKPRKARGAAKNGNDGDAVEQPPPPPPPSDDAPELIRNLLKQLPPEGATWSRAKAKSWLTIAETTFDLVYSWDDQAAPARKPTGGGSDD
jgi:hypothetical protein